MFAEMAKCTNQHLEFFRVGDLSHFMYPVTKHEPWYDLLDDDCDLRSVCCACKVKKNTRNN